MTNNSRREIENISEHIESEDDVDVSHVRRMLALG